MLWPREQIQNCWVDELQVFPFFFAQHFLISPFRSQSWGSSLHVTSNRIFDSVLPMKIRIHLWIHGCRVKLGGNNKHPLPTAGHFVKYAAVRGAGGLLGPFHPALTNFGEDACPVCPQRAGVAAHVLLFCHSWESSALDHILVGWWVLLHLSLAFPSKSGVNRAQQTVILASWQWFLWLTRVWVEVLWKIIIKKNYFYF